MAVFTPLFDPEVKVKGKGHAVIKCAAGEGIQVDMTVSSLDNDKATPKSGCQYDCEYNVIVQLR